MKITVAGATKPREAAEVGVLFDQLLARVGELPLERLRLVHDTVTRQDRALAGEAAVRVLEVTTAELIRRSVPVCSDCSALDRVHASWCPTAARGDAA